MDRPQNMVVNIAFYKNFFLFSVFFVSKNLPQHPAIISRTPQSTPHTPQSTPPYPRNQHPARRILENSFSDNARQKLWQKLGNPAGLNTILKILLPSNIIPAPPPPPPNINVEVVAHAQTLQGQH